MSYTPTEWESTDVVTATRLNALEQAVGDLNMSYTPNVWQNGDILTADKMNALEQAVASGGGGSSDFSTATVTFINSMGLTMDLTVPRVCPNDEEGVGLVSSYLFCMDYTIEEDDSLVLDVPLYTGNLVIVNTGDPDNTAVTGDIELLYGGNLIAIQGDGTVTFS